MYLVRVCVCVCVCVCVKTSQRPPKASPKADVRSGPKGDSHDTLKDSQDYLFSDDQQCASQNGAVGMSRSAQRL
jgi:hypothetical protein